MLSVLLCLCDYVNNFNTEVQPMLPTLQFEPAMSGWSLYGECQRLIASIGIPGVQIVRHDDDVPILKHLHWVDSHLRWLVVDRLHKHAKVMT